ncbi:MAG: hypothetical protein GY811_10770 [Myxococcales bacterium]|nr:hypothetical protein [Myxococcales bacterium]
MLRAQTGVALAEKRVALVARFPGAIGYMRADMMPSWVKAVPIGGKSHTDPGYPLYVRVP